MDIIYNITRYKIEASFVLFCIIYTYLLFWRFKIKPEDTNVGVLIGFVCILCSFLFNIFLQIPVLSLLAQLCSSNSSVSFSLLTIFKQSILDSLFFCIPHCLGLVVLCFTDRKYFIYYIIVIFILNYFITAISFY